MSLRLKRTSALACTAILACFLAGVPSSHSATTASSVTTGPAHHLTVQSSVNAAEQVFTPKASGALSASSAPPPTEWNKTYGGTGDDVAVSVVQTGDGGYVMAGDTDSFGAGYDDFWLVKTDAGGRMEWNKTYGGTDIDRVFSVVQTGDGGYAMAGCTGSFGAGGYDFWLVKTDAGGSMEWNRTYGGGGTEMAGSVVHTGDGGYAMAGFTYSFGAGYDDFWLVKTDAGGRMEWNKTYGGVDIDRARSVVQTGDGGYAIAGETWSFGAGHNDFWLVKTDAAGNMEWNKTYGGGGEEYPFSLVQTGDGGYALAGGAEPFGVGLSDFWLVKTDAAGNMEWNKTYGGTWEDSVHSLVQTGDGGYALAGKTRSFGAGYYDLWLVKTDAAGNMEWNKTYGGTGKEGALSVVHTGDGGYAMAGYTDSFGAGYDDFWLVKVAPQRDIAVTDVSPSRTVVGQGYPVSVNVTVQNQGDHTETFNVTAYANATQIGEKTVTGLDPRADGVLSITWDTAGFDLGNYTVSAVADVVANETDTLDNTCIDGVVTVTLPFHDVAVVGVSPASDAVPAGFDLDISVTVEDLGDFVETFNVTVYANATIVGEQEVLLNSGESGILVFAWSTAGFSVGNYTISAYAAPVAEETNTDDNAYTDGVVTVWLPVYDVAVTDVAAYRTVVGQGYSASINVTVGNEGSFTETFDVTAYANTTAIQTLAVTDLPAGSSTTITFAWNTTGVAKGNYSISAYATPLLNEVDTADNTLIDGWILVTVPGDVDGDRDVDIFDIVVMAGSYGSEEGEPKYVPNFDIEGDGDVDILDIVAAAGNYGGSW